MNYKIILLLSSIFTISIKSTKDPNGQEYILAFLNRCKEKEKQPITYRDIDNLTYGTYQVMSECEDVLYKSNPSKTEIESTSNLLGNIKSLLIKHCQNKDYLRPYQIEVCKVQLKQIENLFEIIQPPEEKKAQKKLRCKLQ